MNEFQKQQFNAAQRAMDKQITEMAQMQTQQVMLFLQAASLAPDYPVDLDNHYILTQKIAKGETLTEHEQLRLQRLQQQIQTRAMEQAAYAALVLSQGLAYFNACMSNMNEQKNKTTLQ